MYLGLLWRISDTSQKDYHPARVTLKRADCLAHKQMYKEVKVEALEVEKSGLRRGLETFDIFVKI